MRIKLKIEYDGTGYSGWQRQENAPSIQQTIEDALSELLGEKTSITGAARTDAGVHALGQIAHFDSDTKIPPEKIAYALNFALPKDIRIRSSMQVSDAFHARFDAKAKWYRYSIYNNRHASALYRNYFCHVAYALDTVVMSEALGCIRGRHDFSAFAASGSVAKETTKEIYVAKLKSVGDRISIDIIGNGFLYNMVRIIAGTLIDIGRGKISSSSLRKMLETKQREDGGITAPPEGLMLMEVFYDSVPTYDKYIYLSSLHDGFITA